MKETEPQDHTAAPGSAQGPTLAVVRRRAAARLAAAGIDSAALDARILVGHGLGLDRDRLLIDSNRAVAPDDLARVDALIDRRAAREPVSRILGHREFWSLEFALTPETLDPRPDSETVIEAALATAPSGPLAILDLGTGSGCLLLALLTERPDAEGVGVDASEGAIQAASANARHLKLSARARFVVADWSRNLTERLESRRFDLIVANPPYIPEGDIAGLEPEVSRFDPLAALTGGADGLDAYRCLAPRMPELLSPGGVVVFEVGIGQAAAVADLLAKAGLHPLGTRTDLGGIERCVIARTAMPRFGEEK